MACGGAPRHGATRLSNAPDLADAYRLLHHDPAEAERICRAVLAKADDPGARLMLAGALRLQHDFAAALALTAPLAAQNPNWVGAQFEHGMALAGARRVEEALRVFGQVRQRAELPGLWREIGDAHWAMGRFNDAEPAYLRHLMSNALEPLAHEAVLAFQGKDSGRAETALRLQLARHPGDVFALRMLAEVLSAADRYEEAETLLHACLERVPSFPLARYGLAMVLFHDHRLAPALEQLEILLNTDAQRHEYLSLKAEAQARLGAFEAAAATLEQILAMRPNDGATLCAYGNILRTLGNREGCEAAYRAAIASNAKPGEAYWGLANLKTLRFSEADVAGLRVRMQQPVTDADDRIALGFALGKALEDTADFAGAFQAYAQANAARRARFPHDREAKAREFARARAVFSRDFYAERAGWGAQERDPIFVVGMPRSGSTLVEQILASHSSVEGTMELNELLAMASRLSSDGRFPEKLRETSLADVAALGREYIERTRIFRHTGKPSFIDKMPNNFQQVGLIQLILPNARIVDVRRHPLACCVSNFKQHWATGQSFAYDLQDIGAFYRGYVELMAHFDEVLPGRVHRVLYEDLVADPEKETRRLLDACGLPFEEACLRFYDNKRAVRTPSSEQVRRPISAASQEDWRAFEPWLQPLKDALGPVLDAYPLAPR